MLPSSLPAPLSGERCLSENGYLRPVITPHLAAIYAMSDTLTIISSLWLAWSLVDGLQWRETLSLAAVCAVGLYLFLASRHGMYRSWRITPAHQELLRVMGIWCMVAALLCLAAVMAGYPIGWGTEPAVLLWLCIAPLALLLQRCVIRSLFRLVRTAGLNYRRVAILGDTDQALRLQSRMEQSSWMGLRLHGIYDDRADKTNKRRYGAPLLGCTDELLRAARDSEIDVIYITLSMAAVERVRGKIMALMDTTTSVYLVPDFFAFGLLESRICWFDDIPVVPVIESPFAGIEGWGKRVEDLVLGSFILLLIAVPMVLIALGIKLDSPGPVFFRQQRYGINGKPIWVWKFRSMMVCEDGQTRFSQVKRNDCRVTAFGAFLRRSSLDELPQFINVLEGSMSIVGPRPHPIALNEHFRSVIPGYMLRHKIKPGITGWAQINGWRGETDTLDKMKKRVEFDHEYVRRWSIGFDLLIITLTLSRGFTGPNAY